MRLEIQEHAGDATSLQSTFESLGICIGKVAQDRFMTAVTNVGRHEVLECFLIHMPDALSRLGMAIVFDMQPAKPLLHGQVLQ